MMARMADSSRYTLRVAPPVAPRGRARTRPATHFEFRVVTIERGTSRAQARQLLADEAEYGKWELARSVLYAGGRRRYWLRRRTMSVDPTWAVDDAL